MSNFFIQRPVFAWVIAIVIMLAGALSILRLPIELYPGVAPPSVVIMANYPGASSATVENSVTQVIEQRLTGIDNLRYFVSNSSDASVTITLTFEPNADPDIAQVQVQNKVQGAVPLLPQEVQAMGVTVSKANSNFLMVASFTSSDGSISQREVGDLVTSTVQDAVARVNGVGSVTVFGDPHAMRIWLNPDQLQAYAVSVGDVQAAIQAQNTDVSAGQLGGLPAVSGQQINATITAQSRLQTVEDFERIILRVNPDGSQLRLADVARVELGSQSYSQVVRYKGRPSAGIAVSMAAGANALQTAQAVKDRIEELRQSLPPAVEVFYPNDTTPFVEASIESVVMTLLEAFVLVFLVMFLFLQNMRATLIPAIAVPVVLLGTFAVLSTLGYSINTLTMFAVVLCIGLLVDDAIVVVENVERLMEEEGLSPREATIKSMGQISGALIGIALVLSAVFVPMAFFAGSAGVIYRQFSVTMITAITLSVFVAMVLSPTLCISFLKPKPHQEGPQKGFFGVFNRNFDRLRDFYRRSCSYMARRIVRYVGLYLGILLVMAFLFARMPGAFLPDEDQGILFFQVTAPAGATIERTLESVQQVEDYMLNEEADNVEHMLTVTGFNFAGMAQNAALGFIMLKDWDERPDPDQTVQAIAGRAMGAFSDIRDAMAFAFYPPPIQELGNAAGFDMQLIDTTGQGHDALVAAQNQLLQGAAESPLLAGVRLNGFEDVPQFKIDLDSERATALGLNMSDINQTLQTAWGSRYINDFVDAGRIKRVYLQADAEFRMLPEDINRWYVRNNNGEMISFDEFSDTHWTYGSPLLTRFNGNSSVNIQGAPAAGVASGAAMDEMERLVGELGEGFSLQWSGISYEERLSGSQAPMLYTLSILIVFLCLAALYESWSVPIAIILVVPLGVVGAIVASLSQGMNNDVYFQVALLTSIGLSAKNAILIVEFAKRLVESGHDVVEATLIATKQRFRPIVMTSMAFMLGVLPMALANGAGSASQNAIGVGVVGGMFSATYLATFFVPMFYVAVMKLFSRRQPDAKTASVPAEKQS
ncbi:MAG: efflux RND transporter permease subunit [Pseudohongiella sp.]|uniref:efflux RND transporter permease subunit n=1 Tax=Pseudohongiella sp. TaxID=1979412 RepID=UPI0034A0327D